MLFRVLVDSCTCSSGSDSDSAAWLQLQINAEKSPFLTERLKVWMLPTLALIRSGSTVDYVVGFQDLGGVDDFPTSVLEARLLVRDCQPLSRGSGVAAMGTCPAAKRRRG